MTDDHLVFREFETGKVQCRVGEDEDMWEALTACMDKQGFYPNVFFVSDHGNVHQLLPERKKTRRNASSLTWGVLPPLKQFAHESEFNQDGEANYPFGMKLNTTDSRVADEVAETVRGLHIGQLTHPRGYTHEIADAEDMHRFLKALLHDGSDRANDLASGIMTTLGYEWI